MIKVGIWVLLTGRRGENNFVILPVRKIHHVDWESVIMWSPTCWPGVGDNVATSADAVSKMDESRIAAVSAMVGVQWDREALMMPLWWLSKTTATIVWSVDIVLHLRRQHWVYVQLPSEGTVFSSAFVTEFWMFFLSGATWAQGWTRVCIGVGGWDAYSLEDVTSGTVVSGRSFCEASAAQI